MLASLARHPPEYLPKGDGPPELVQRFTVHSEVLIAVHSPAGMDQSCFP